MNPRELDVLKILWEHDEPMMATDIVNAGSYGLTQSTVTAVLRKLLRAKLVEVAGVTHSGKVLSRTYRPTPAAREAAMEYFLAIYRPFQSIVTPEELLAAMKYMARLTDSRQKLKNSQPVHVEKTDQYLCPQCAAELTKYRNCSKCGKVIIWKKGGAT